jgi:hypothetical protein
MQRMHEEAYQRLTVYYWCWMFTRLSPALIYAYEREIKPRDAALARVLDALGRIDLNNFDAWWQRFGVVAFAEAELPEVQVIKPHDLSSEAMEPDESPTLYVKIPLTIRPKTIIRKVKELLETAGHVGNTFDPAPYGKAPFPLYTLRYHVLNIQRRYWVLLYRLLYPDVPVWLIGDRLRVAPALNVRGVWPSADDQIRRRIASLHSLTGRDLYKARYMLTHLERGDFPRDSKVVDEDSWTRHFGPRQAKAYQRFVLGNNDGDDSEWISWLKRRHLAPLQEHVADVNRANSRRPLSREMSQGVDKFMRGEKDHISAVRASRRSED